MTDLTKDLLATLSLIGYTTAIVFSIGLLVMQPHHSLHSVAAETTRNIVDNFGPGRSPLDYRP